MLVLRFRFTDLAFLAATNSAENLAMVDDKTLQALYIG
jgi:hypothetical protein